MPHKKRSKLGLPLLLGAITFGLILLALWPDEPTTVQVVVAARDLGAGALLTPADLSTITMEADVAPADASSDPTPLVGGTLAVVRFQGEPISLRHLGPAVAVQPYERAVSLQVKQDQGLAGILRPGMHVGVVATLPDFDGNIFAKTMLEDLRVVYVSPDFQARPEMPITAKMTVENGSATMTGGEISRTASQAREGIVIVAAPIDPQPITYVPITETMPITYTLVDGESQKPAVGDLEGGVEATSVTYADQPMAIWEAPVGVPDMLSAETAWVTPVELLAALNAEGQAFTLVLMPEQAEPYVSAGLNLSTLIPPHPTFEEVQP